MPDQNLNNHTRFVPAYHFVASLLLIAALGGSIVNTIHTMHENVQGHYSAALITLICIVLIIIYWYARSFALRAQDRAIRAEENFRHFVLTGKPLPASLGMSQIIALRFASDDEFVALAQKAATENMSSKAIKQAIQHWRADYDRV